MNFEMTRFFRSENKEKYYVSTSEGNIAEVVVNYCQSVEITINMLKEHRFFVPYQIMSTVFYTVLISFLDTSKIDWHIYGYEKEVA